MGYQMTIIEGNLGRDAEQKYLQSGVSVVNFSVAVNEVSGSGETRKETTTWYRVAAWRELGERLAPYLTKGKDVLVEGRVTSRPYLDSSGQPASSLELTANRIQLLGSRDASDEDTQDDAQVIEDVPF